MNNPRLLSLFIFIFTLSGFSGLIYQSIWTHYLKLYLGHASYAQVLVLGIFMGGMAIGSALASRFSYRFSNLILLYGIAEGIIGLFGLGFHQIFIATQELSYSSIFPALGSPFTVQSTKWLIGAALILPQSILLGATFPLLSAGLLRRFSQKENSPHQNKHSQTGKILATLYFVNSLGAAIGILCNAFIIIPKVGLPGSLLTAGLINIVLAIIVYQLSKNDQPLSHTVNTPSEAETLDKTLNNKSILIFMLVLASLTGLASFMYEIAWIRMLTMVLGGSTHSFEIMLSAFILGLALGGWWIRPRIDHFKEPLIALGVIQILMGTLAALTIPLYNYSYEVMSFAINALTKTDEGYFLYSLFSYGISLLIMLPAAFCAGTTLPLATYILLKQGHNDSAIGKVYAWNTLGSIAGIAIAIHLVMPLLGLKWVVLCGAFVDLILGIVLIQKFSNKTKNAGLFYYGSPLLVLALVFLSLTEQLDTKKMASGVFRYGGDPSQSNEIIFHKDGKTSTVAVKQFSNGTRVILNNGKPDAGILIPLEESHTLEKYTSDEPTMILLGTLPYVYNPKATQVANIGLGSGLTAHTLLQNSQLNSLETIEIERQVAEAAKLFYPKVFKAFDDPRSHIIFEDAKTYFAAQQKLYDVIVSEPPNPWVAGVSGLFSDEFYKHIKQYLKNDGVFVQWMHLYEMNLSLVASVYLSLAKEFQYIHFYQISGSDIAMVASNQILNADYNFPFTQPELEKTLHQIQIKSNADFQARFLGNSKELQLTLTSLTQHSNSDFFPILDQGASKARFKFENARALYQMYQASVLKKLTHNKSNDVTQNINLDSYIAHTQALIEKEKFFYTLKNTKSLNTKNILDFDKHSIGEINAYKILAILSQCHSKDTHNKLTQSNVMITITGWAGELASDTDMQYLTGQLSTCDKTFTDNGKIWISALNAWYLNDFDEVAKITHAFLYDKESLTSGFDTHLIKLNMASSLASGNPEYIRATQQLIFKIPNSQIIDLEMEALRQIFK